MRIVWIWCDFEKKIVKSSELTPEERLLSGLTCAKFGRDVEAAWERIDEDPGFWTKESF